jgi:hypothetical protein
MDLKEFKEKYKKGTLTEEEVNESIKEACFVSNMFYDDEIDAYYTDDEKEIQENITNIIENIQELDENELITSKDTLINHDYFLHLLGHVITGKGVNTLNDNMLNRLIESYDKINNFFSNEGDNAFKILEDYNGEIIEKDSEGFYKLNDTIVNKVIEDNDFYITNSETKETIKTEIFNTWENQKELLTQDSLNKYSENRNGINFKYFIFCEEYIKRGKIKPTCDYLGISRNTAYTWLKDEKVSNYLKDRQEEIRKETDNAFINTYRACFDELDDLIKGNYTNNTDKIKAIDTFLRHYANIQRVKQGNIQEE